MKENEAKENERKENKAMKIKANQNAPGRRGVCSRPLA
jgi:hypothetical protein